MITAWFIVWGLLTGGLLVHVVEHKPKPQPQNTITVIGYDGTAKEKEGCK